MPNWQTPLTEKYVFAFLAYVGSNSASAYQTILGANSDANIVAAQISFLYSPTGSINVATVNISGVNQTFPTDIYWNTTFTSAGSCPVVVMLTGLVGDKSNMGAYGDFFANNGYIALAFSSQEYTPLYVWANDNAFAIRQKEGALDIINYIENNATFASNYPMANLTGLCLWGGSGGGGTSTFVNSSYVKVIASTIPYYDTNVIVNAVPILFIPHQSDTTAPPVMANNFYGNDTAVKMLIEEAGTGHSNDVFDLKYSLVWFNYWLSNVRFFNSSNIDPSIIHSDSSVSRILYNFAFLTIGSISTNTTTAGALASFNANLTDTFTVSSFRWGSNCSGSVVNGTWQAFTSNPVTYTTTLSANVGDTDTVTLYANDTSGNLASATYSITLTDGAPPVPSSISASTTVAGQSCSFGVTWTDNVGLSYGIFGTNNTGHWVNDTAGAFTTNPQATAIIKTLNSTAGVIVQWEEWANDTSNNWVNTGIQTLTITPSSLNHITVTPSTATITAGAQQTYSSTAYDAYGNSLGSVTGSTSWSISAGAGGSWRSNTYTSQNNGVFTITATYSGIQATATLTVNDVPTPTPSSTPSPTATPGSTPTSTTITQSTPSPTPAVPEFPTGLIVPLFAVAILLLIVFIRKRIPKR